MTRLIVDRKVRTVCGLLVTGIAALWIGTGATTVGDASGSFTSSLVASVNLATITPPSPDPSGLTYLPASNTLLMTDGEVEETVNGITHFAGTNVWQLSLSGAVVRTTNISKIAPTLVPMTNEPTGIAWDPASGHYFVTDDDAHRVYDLNPGTDGLPGTSDDTFTFFSTVLDNPDPEGITVNPATGRLFVVDGLGSEVFEYTTTGSLFNRFGVAAFGVDDPESVEFNPDAGTLFVLSNHANKKIVEIATTGALFRTIDISAASPYAGAGLAYGPASDGSGAKRFYVVDRGIDNNVNPSIVDGKLFELSAPPTAAPQSAAPTVSAGPDQTVVLPDSAVLDGTVTDDNQPSPIAATWSQVSGPGTVTFGSTSAVDTTATFSIPGTYILRLIVTDGEWTAADEVTMTVTGNGAVTTFDTYVTTSSDDAEERSSGTVSLTSTDLDLMYDAGSTPPLSFAAVGMRFTGVSIPQGAQITSAYVQFTTDEANSEPTSLTIRGHAADDAPTFTNTSKNITLRTPTSASVDWTPPPWLVVYQAGTDQRTPELASVIQEIVSRPGWASGNALALIVTGTPASQRVAYAVDANHPTRAPSLHIEWTVGGGPVNTPPGATISAPSDGSTFPQGTPITFTGSASDTQDGDVTPSLVWTSNLDDQIGTGASFQTSALSGGTHTITATATDSGGLTGSATITVTVQAPTNAPPAVSAGPDLAVTLPATAALDGTVSDDGLPSPPGTLTTTWSKVSGPGTVTFGNAAAVDTTASFSAPGTYVLRLTASDGELSTNDDATVTVATDLIFEDGFEGGNLSAWGGPNAIDGGNLSVTPAAALVGTGGMQALINDNKPLYVTDGTPAAEPRYRARFYFDPNAIVMSKGDKHVLFAARTASGATTAQIEMRMSGGNYQLRAQIADDGGSLSGGSWFTLTNASHAIEIDWRASTAAGANNGSLTFWVDGVQRSSTTGIDNDTQRVEEARLGPSIGIDKGTRGTYYLDAFVSNRTAPIGP